MSNKIWNKIHLAIAIIKAFRPTSKCLYCLTKIKNLVILIVVDRTVYWTKTNADKKLQQILIVVDRTVYWTQPAL